MAPSDSETTPLLSSATSSHTAVQASSEPSSPLISSLAHFPPGDPANPRNWPEWRKWSIVAVLVPVDLSVSWAASGFSPAMVSFREEFSVSQTVATAGLSVYVFGLALGPMSLAPLSEFFGRSIIYIWSYGFFLILLACTAIAPNVPIFMALRFFSGLFVATTIANFGGTIADLWPHAQTGRAMSAYIWAGTAGSPTGFFLLSAVAEHYPWRGVFWALLALNGTVWLVMALVLKETRHTTILRKRAKKALRSRCNGGGETETAVAKPEALERRSASELWNVALKRPFRFLATEAIVVFGALYNGYLYGLSFLFNGAFVQVFGKSGHGFGTFGVGCAFLGIALGISVGPFTNIWQERYYQRKLKEDGGNNVAESRVEMSKIAAVVFPLSMFWFAWTTDASTHHPLVPIVASFFWGWSFYTLILMTMQYAEDSYRVYSASALAGIGLARNTVGAAFPMFGRQLFAKLGYQWGPSLLAFLSIALVPIPFVLSRRGYELRKRSPWAREHMSDSGDGEDD